MRALLFSATKCCVMPPMQRNMIYSDAYLSIDQVREKRAKKRNRIREPGQFIRAARKDFNEYGIRNMLISDLYRMADDAETEDDLLLVVNVLRNFLKSSCAISQDFSQIVTRMLDVCFVLNSVKAANEMWHDPELSPFLIGDKPRLRYMVLLYNNGHYSSLAQLAKENPQCVVFPQSHVILAALYKIGTREAFELAKTCFYVQNIWPKRGDFHRGRRSTLLYAFFAYRMGELAHAYEVLNNPIFRRGQNNLSMNIQLQILADMGRFQDALLLIRNRLSMRFVTIFYLICFDILRDCVCFIGQNYKKVVKYFLEEKSSPTW